MDEKSCVKATKRKLGTREQGKQGANRLLYELQLDEFAGSRL
jgi:hypothetical protein